MVSTDVPRPLKDALVRLTSLVNGLPGVLSKVGIRVDKVDHVTLAKIIDQLTNAFSDYLAKNESTRQHYVIVNKILSEFEQVVRGTNDLRAKYFSDMSKISIDELTSRMTSFEREWAQLVKRFRDADILSVEIDECAGLRWWKDEYARGRDLVNLIVWLSYLIPFMRALELISDVEEVSPQAVEFFARRINMIGIMMRAILR